MLRVLQCYNPRGTEGFCIIRVQQGCYKVVSGRYGERDPGVNQRKSLMLIEAAKHRPVKLAARSKFRRPRLDAVPEFQEFVPDERVEAVSQFTGRTNRQKQRTGGVVAYFGVP